MPRVRIDNKTLAELSLHGPTSVPPPLFAIDFFFDQTNLSEDAARKTIELFKQGVITKAQARDYLGLSDVRERVARLRAAQVNDEQYNAAEQSKDS